MRKLTDDFQRISWYDEIKHGFYGKAFNPTLNRARALWFLLGMVFSVVILNALDLLK